MASESMEMVSTDQECFDLIGFITEFDEISGDNVGSDADVGSDGKNVDSFVESNGINDNILNRINGNIFNGSDGKNIGSFVDSNSIGTGSNGILDDLDVDAVSEEILRDLSSSSDDACSSAGVPSPPSSGSNFVLSNVT